MSFKGLTPYLENRGLRPTISGQTKNNLEFPILRKNLDRETFMTSTDGYYNKSLDFEQHKSHCGFAKIFLGIVSAESSALNVNRFPKVARRYINPLGEI